MREHILTRQTGHPHPTPFRYVHATRAAENIIVTTTQKYLLSTVVQKKALKTDEVTSNFGLHRSTSKRVGSRCIEICANNRICLNSGSEHISTTNRHTCLSMKPVQRAAPNFPKRIVFSTMSMEFGRYQLAKITGREPMFHIFVPWLPMPLFAKSIYYCI